MDSLANAREILTSFSFVLSWWVSSHSFWKLVHGGGAVGELDQLVNENVVACAGWDCCWCEENLGYTKYNPSTEMGEVMYLGVLVYEDMAYQGTAVVLVECPCFLTLTQSQTPPSQLATFVHG